MLGLLTPETPMAFQINCCMQRQVCNPSCADPLSTDPKLGQSDIVYWIYR